MIKKYNLALIPISESQTVTALTQNFKGLEDKYILGESSLPHVTLYQFYFEEMEIKKLWENICSQWQENPITLTFKEWSFTTSNNEIYWIALMPEQFDQLYKMHRNIAQLIQLPIKETFDPHMTLLNTRQQCRNQIQTFSSNYQPITNTFILSLGACDEVGQYTRIIYQLSLPNI